MDASYDLTPEQLVERIPSCDALIIRSATKVLAFGRDRVSMERAYVICIALSTTRQRAWSRGQGAEPSSETRHDGPHASETMHANCMHQQPDACQVIACAWQGMR